MCDLLEVLAAAHAKGIVHRDIKPENLFLTHESEVKVLDFGIARLHKQASPTATGHGAVFGTPGFMPPEQALGHSDEIDALSDIWAVGATAYCLLSGHFVHEGKTSAETIVHAATRPVAPLSSVAPWVPASVAQVFDRALAFERRDRWTTASAMRDALLAARNSGEPRTRSEADDLTKVNPPPMDASEGRASSPEGAVLGPNDPSTRPVGSTVAGLVSSSEARRAQARKWVVVGASVAAGLVAVLAIGVAIRSPRSGSPGPDAVSPTADLRASAGTMAPSAALAPNAVPAEAERAALPWVPVEALPKATSAASASAAVRAVSSPAPRPHVTTAPAAPSSAPHPPAPPPPPPASKRDPLAPPM